MRYRRRLRSRIILSFLLLGFGLTASFALATVYLRERLEDQLIGAALLNNVGDYADQFYVDPARAGIPFERISGRVFSKARLGNVPFAWRDLPNGIHELSEIGPDGKPRTYKLAVRKDDEYWFFLSYDIAQERTSQQQLMVALGIAVLIFTLLAWMIGMWASSKVMRPVADLLKRVQSMGQSTSHTPVAHEFLDDEVGQLAAALDDYALRMTQLVQRDREFNSDVSHELRTPLAVIRGAAELLLTKPQLDEKTRARLMRIERAAQQSTDLTTALLMLSRNERGTGQTDVRKLAEALADANRAQLVGKQIELVVEGCEDVCINAPEAVIAVALGNLIGNACKYTNEGQVRIVIEPNLVRVFDSGPGLSEEDAKRLFERGYRGSGAGATTGGGIGLSIVSRLCNLYQWQVSVAPRPEGGAVAVLKFAD